MISYTINYKIFLDAEKREINNKYFPNLIEILIDTFSKLDNGVHLKYYSENYFELLIIILQ